MVEDHLLGDEQFNSIDNFWVPYGSRKLMFFYQEKDTNPNKKLFITQGNVEGLNGVCLFFLRTNPEKAITTNNVSSEVTFMWMDCSGGNVLEEFEGMMKRVLIPVAKTQQSWGKDWDKDNSQVAEFIESLSVFSENLSMARTSMTGHMTLSDTEFGDHLDSMRTPADYQAASNSREFVKHMEELLFVWCRQIEQVLTESEQIRREADDVGPSAELVYWRNRMTKFNSLLEQIKTPRCKAVIGILVAHRSKCLRKWRELDARITDSANEAKDNVKYLYTLDKFFGPLDKCNPATLLELVPGLINAAQMIYSISTYYNTPERMTSLFVKMTNQLIKICKAYINEGVTKVWEHSRTEMVRRTGDCVKLNAAYQQQFHKTKERLRKTPYERQFEFSENYIFGKFDAFSKRLQKIENMYLTMDGFSGLANLRVDGIEVINTKYKNLCESAKKRNYDVLDYRKQEFDYDYADFCAQFDALQSMIQRFIDAWLDRHLTTEQALELLSKFEIIDNCQQDLVDRKSVV